MKTKIVWVLALLLVAPWVAPWAEAQQVSRLEIAKGADGSEARTGIDITIPLDIADLDFNNPINPDRTRLAVAKDDSGADLLAAHEALAAEWVAQGYATESAISFAGVADYENNKDVKVGIMLKAAPAAGARVIELEGTIALNFIDASSTASTRLQSIPMEAEWGSPGVETPIGPVRIEPSSSMYMDDVNYQGYQVVSPNAPVISVGVVGGDASAEWQQMGMGLEPGMFVIKGEPPQTVDLDLTYAATETREFPFKLSVGVGF
jgi:hypothetical protein